jgi:putative ABC transport system permease protein
MVITLLQELRQRARSLRWTPGYSVPAAGTLLLGVAGGGTALAFAWSGLAGSDGHRPDPGGWHGGWTEHARSTFAIVQEGLHSLLRVTEAAGLLILIAVVVNVGLLVVARSTGRRRELALRVAVGTPPRRLAGHLLIDSVPFAVLATSLALVLAVAALGILRLTWPEALPVRVTGEQVLRGLTVAATLPLAALACIVLLPLRRLYTGDERGELQQSLRTGTHATTGPNEGIFRNWLGTFSVAVSVALLIGAGSLLQGFVAADGNRRPDLGIDRYDTLTLHLDLSAASRTATTPPGELQVAILEHLSRVPGVRGASLSTPGTWLGIGDEDRIRAHCGWCWRGTLLLFMTQGPARHHVVSPGFFSTHGVQLVSGREFSHRDDSDAQLVAVVNQTFSYHYFPNVAALDKPVQIGGRDGEMFTVIGIVEDIRIPALGRGSDAIPAVYFSSLQRPPSLVGVAVRTEGRPPDDVGPMLAAIGEADPGLTASDVMLLDDRIDRAAGPLRWFGGIFAGLGAVALILAVLGVFGTLAHNMTRRIQEMGIRIALGAHPRDIRRVVLRQASRIVSTGIWLGVLAGIGISRLLQLLFLGVRAVDPPVIAAVVTVVLFAALLATLGPTRFALRADPMTVLKAE